LKVIDKYFDHPDEKVRCDLSRISKFAMHSIKPYIDETIINAFLFDTLPQGVWPQGYEINTIDGLLKYAELDHKYSARDTVGKETIEFYDARYDGREDDFRATQKYETFRQQSKEIRKAVSMKMRLHCDTDDYPEINYYCEKYGQNTLNILRIVENAGIMSTLD